MWAGTPGRDSSADEAVLLHAVGSNEFILRQCLVKLERDYLDAIDKLRDVLQFAPKGRDVHSSVERHTADMHHSEVNALCESLSAVLDQVHSEAL